MEEIIVTTPEKLRQLLRDAVQDGVAGVLKEISSKIPAYMTEAEAGEYLSISPITLRTWRMEKKGPKYRKFDRSVRYCKSDLDEWMKSCEMLTIDALEARHGKSG